MHSAELVRRRRTPRRVAPGARKVGAHASDLGGRFAGRELDQVETIAEPERALARRRRVKIDGEWKIRSSKLTRLHHVET